MKVKLGKAAVMVVVIVIVVALASSSFLLISFTPNKPLESITIGATLLESTGPLFVAEDQHFFADNGLNVSIKYFDVGLNAVNALISGQVDMAQSSEYILVGKALANQQIQTIGSISKTDFASVVARRDHGIHNISDLAGKKIGVVRGTVMEYYLGAFLELNGLKISQVNLVNITLGSSANVLIDGAVDAMMSFPPYVETAQQQLGSNAVVWAGQGTQLLYGLITCRADWIVQHKGTVNNFLRAVSKAEDFMALHPDKAKSILQGAMNFTDVYMGKVWSRNEFALSLDQSMVAAMENEARWMVASKLIPQTNIPDFINYIYFDGLTTIKPEAVNVIQ